MVQIMRKPLQSAAIIAGVVLSAHSAAASVVTLTFEGIGDENPIGDHYSGGAGGNLGISSGPDSLAVVSNQDEGSGNFTNAPSGDTIAFFLNGPGDVMNVARGFKTGFGFYYADQTGFTGSVQLYGGLNGTGKLLADLTLPSMPDPFSVFVPIGVAFKDTAESVIFGGSANYIGFDNVTLGAAIPVGVPEPISMGVFGAGLAILATVVTGRRRQGGGANLFRDAARLEAC